MKTLSRLKSICITTRTLSEKEPDSKPLQRAYELAQRAVDAKEREVFCSIKEQ
jgi:hypothetical protein